MINSVQRGGAAGACHDVITPSHSTARPDCGPLLTLFDLQAGEILWQHLSSL